MRFHVALDSLEKENQVLRYSVIGLLFLAVVLCSGILYVSLKDPLIIERACYSKSVSLAKTTPTKEETASFLEIALRQRFDSEASDSNFLTAEQLTARGREQAELSRQKLTQKVLINKIDVTTDGTLSVDADRFIAVGEVRTVLRFPLKVEIARLDRSQVNPYGLLLINVQPANNKDDTKTKEAQ
jgi:hypothetical protein